MGWSETQSGVGGAVLGGILCCYMSHPFDTVKTCMQGDVERSTYKVQLPKQNK